ncbi:helix-turn-helix transcriptional regulator [Streptomyces apocyni]|uniref:helix-turn-helix transcriptional regulator n=1 Tax=Streptomyces apocyni TaxID=2654677 RepID=UPI0012EA404F|nr:helix-turn-helix transcriptional regulator [Streptomyces apocyni]
MESSTHAMCACTTDTFDELRAAVAQLSGLTQALGASAVPGDHGALRPASVDRIDEVFAAVVRATRLELLEVRPEPPRPHEAAAATAPTLRHQVIVDSQAAVTTAAATAAAPTGPGVEIRAMPLVPVRMAVSDREALVVAIGLTEDTGYLLVDRQSDAAARLATRFLAQWWPRARHYCPAPDASTTQAVSKAAESATEAAVLAALVQGLTDDCVARRVGVTPRTVRRHVAAVSARFGATSRLQLGVLIGRTVQETQTEAEKAEAEAATATATATEAGAGGRYG